MWLTTFEAGFTHPRSMEAMGPRESANTERARTCLLKGTLQGHDLVDLMQSDCTDQFDDVERALIILGSESGGMDKSLRQLSDFHERKHYLMLWIKRRLAYPLMTALAACFVVPLPLLVFGHPATYVISAIACSLLFLMFAQGIVAAAAARYGRQPGIARARMARALATAIEAGLTLPRATRLAAGASANHHIQQFVGSIDERSLATTPIGRSLAGCPHLTADFLAVLSTTEHTGDVSALKRLADLYEAGFR